MKRLITLLLNADITQLVQSDYSFQLSSGEVSYLVNLREAKSGKDTIASALVNLAKPFGLSFDASDVVALVQACPMPTTRAVVYADCAAAINKMALVKGVSGE